MAAGSAEAAVAGGGEATRPFGMIMGLILGGPKLMGWQCCGSPWRK